MPKHRADLLACAAAARAMLDGAVEETFYPRNPLDVLAQQIVATCVTGSIAVDALYEMVRRAAPFADLPRGAFEGVLDMLAGRYPSDAFAELRPRVTWDRARGVLHARQGAQKLALLNGGTIPDRGNFGVFLPGESGSKVSRRVGELDEEMVFEMREGDVFLLGASSWRAEEITRDQVIVSPAAGVPGRMPFWHGDRPGRPRAFGARIGNLTRAIADEKPEKAKALLLKGHALDANAADNLIAYVHEQASVTGEVPSDKTIVVERFTDELGDWRVCVMSPFGARVHAPWATAITARLRARHAGDIETVWSDDGMVFRVPEADTAPEWDSFFPPSSDIERIATEELGQTSLFAGRFRECAGRALLLPRRQPTKRTPLWAQRKRAQDLLHVASQHPEFPIVLETYRECLRDVFDMPGLVDLLRQVEQRTVRVVTAETRRPSPFAAQLLFSFVGNFIYDGDAPSAERRAQALSIDHAQLRELLGEAELRRLLDPDAIEEHTASLQRLTHKARHADGLHDVLLWLGDLTLEEAEARAESASAWLEDLVRARRVVEVRIAGEKRFLAVEDVGRVRDALGVPPPRGVPEAYLAPVADPVGDLVARYARTHGPFTDADVARRLGLAPAVVRDALARLVRAGRVVTGAFLPGGTSSEHCDAEVLRVLRRKSLAKLRREVEPVDAAAYARFLLDWAHVGKKLRGADALLLAIGQLEGCPIPASVLEDEVLAARVEGFRPSDLDLLCARGDVVWAGVEPLGPGDGRLALFLADHEPLLGPPPREVEGEHAVAIRKVLERRGAVFFDELAREVGGFPAATLEVLWDMVWAGEVTNDTLAPLRSWMQGRTGEKKRGRPGPRPATGSAPGLRPATGWRRSAPGSEGRWSLRRVRREGHGPSDTERRAALARALLERYGVVTREAAHAEGIAGGFTAVYEVLKAMEEAGRVRRGYFVAERGATQFALPGADDRLRAAREVGEPARPQLVILAATDPANPYGASLAWPERGAQGPRPQRAAGAKVILRDGALLAWLGRREEALLTFLPTEEPQAAACASDLVAKVAELVTSSASRRAVLIATIDGVPASSHPVAPLFQRAGFVKKTGSALLLRRYADTQLRLVARDA
jgi:ATP-dependent Lhr-like helicase